MAAPRRDSPSLEPPKTEDQPAPIIESAEMLKRVTDLEQTTEHVKTSLSQTQDTNKFIIIVLFVGLIALIITVGLFVVQSFVAQKDSHDTEIRTIQQLEDKLDARQTPSQN